MIHVNAVDSFCDMKLVETTGNGEKKLYLSRVSSEQFMSMYLGINVANGANIHEYNSEVRARTRGYRGFIRKSNLQEVFNRTSCEYQNQGKYRTDLEGLRRRNQESLDLMEDIAYFTIDCSISQERIYIGSQDPNWFLIPQFCIPRESEVIITNTNNAGILEFEIR